MTRNSDSISRKLRGARSFPLAKRFKCTLRESIGCIASVLRPVLPFSAVSMESWRRRAALLRAPKFRRDRWRSAESKPAVYPIRSPGGWNVIGRTPWRMFDVNREPPTALHAGDSRSFPIHFARRVRLVRQMISANPSRWTTGKCSGPWPSRSARGWYWNQWRA